MPVGVRIQWSFCSYYSFIRIGNSALFGSYALLTLVNMLLWLEQTQQ